MQNLEVALEYLTKGWSVIPICSPDHSGCSPSHIQTCSNPGKGATVKWAKFQTELPTEADLKKSFQKNSNIGVVMGRVSGLIGLDIDGPHAWHFYFDLAEGQHQETLSYPTPGGKRLLFRIPKDLYIPKRRFEAGASSHVILLGEGSYTVVPPSIHASGAKYGPWSGTLADCPKWILELACEPPEHPSGDYQVYGGTEVNPQTLKRVIAYLKKCDPCIAGQKGHNQAFKIANKIIHGFGLNPEQALPIILEHYNPRCEPPWMAKEWEHKLQEAKNKGTATDMGPHKDKWQLKPITQLRKPSPQQWLIDKLIPKNGITLMSAKPKCGKTTFLAALLQALEQGSDFCQLAVEKGKVIIVSEEPEEWWSIRCEQWGYSDYHECTCLPFHSKPDLKEWEQFCKWLSKSRKPETKLIVFDTLSGLGPMEDENSNSEVGRYFPPIRTLSESGIAILLCHHHGHQGQRSRGASAVLQQVDVIIDLTYYEDEDSSLRKLKLKGRLPGLINTLVIDFDPITFQYEQVEVEEPIKPKQITVTDIIFEIVPEEEPGWTVNEFLDNWPNDDKPAVKTLQNRLTELVKEELFVQTKEGKTKRYYRVVQEE